MKCSKQKLVLVFVFVFFCLIINVYAEGKYIVTTDAVFIRKGAGTNYEHYALANIGSKYYLKSDELVEDSSGGCSEGWYEINYNGSSAYICSGFAKKYEEAPAIPDNVEPSNTCEIELKSKGFNSSYFVPLCKLKEKYPNWTFEPIITGLDFNVVVDQESKCGKSYIETNDPNYQDTSCKSAYSASSIWKPASLGAVRYYLDPRNFFEERRIFMFETLSYMESLSTVYPEAINSVLKGAAFYQYHAGIGNNLSLILNQVGGEINVSPTFIASRIYQEIGAGNSLYNLYSGVYPGYEGYYNFYNAGVSDSCANEKGTTSCGLDYAKTKNWYGLNSALTGGVEFIRNEYINANQNTRYLQKFNVAPKSPSSIYNHQYMTNIRAPYGESSTAYNFYNSIGALNSGFSFSIPVYENMPLVTTLPTSPSDNNGAVDPGDTGSSSSPSSLAATSIIISSGYKYSGKNITGIPVGSEVQDVKAKMESIAGQGNITIKDKNDNVVTSGKVGTGFIVEISGSSKETFTVIIYGDVSGDGEIGPLDLLMVQRHILKTESLTGVYYNAADPNRDGAVKAYDLLLVQRHILKAESITQ